MSAPQTSERLPLGITIAALVVGLLLLLFFYLGVASNMGFGSSSGITFVVLTAIEARAFVGSRSGVARAI
jgi:hypothetical protein